LRVFDVARQCVDNITCETRAVGRGQRHALLALEVIMQDQFLGVLGKDQIDAGTLEFSVEKQVRIRNDNRVRRNVRGVNRLDVDGPIRMQPRALSRKLGVEFASKMVNIDIISKSKLPYHWEWRRETISCLWSIRANRLYRSRREISDPETFNTWSIRQISDRSTIVFRPIDRDI
jgi:hypothetical protein